MLPVFPDFAPLGLDLKPAYDDLVKEFETYSDFNFVSLFTWDTNDDLRVSTLHGNVVIRFNDYVTNELFMSFLGTREVEHTIPALLAYAKEHGIQEQLKLVPEVVVDALPPAAKERYVIEEDRDSFDYILSVADLVEFRVSKYGSKKSWHNYFVTHYGTQATSGEIDLGDAAVQAQIEDVVKDWLRSRNKSDEESKNELIAIKRCLDHHRQLGVAGFGVHIADKLIAFQIIENSFHSTTIDHYEKANADYKGVFEYLKHNGAKHLAAQHIGFINMEQDLGIEGLRRAKESYKPVRYLKKFTVAPKQS